MVGVEMKNHLVKARLLELKWWMEDSLRSNHLLLQVMQVGWEKVSVHMCVPEVALKTHLEALMGWGQ